MLRNIFFILSASIFLLYSCSALSPEEDNATVVQEDDKIFIVDRTNKKWDITHAVNEYNFNPNAFQYGLGPFAIQPINNPEMLSPGDAGYPSSTNATLVIGTTLNHDTRAYPLDVLSRHEIVNEKFGNRNFAIGY